MAPARQLSMDRPRSQSASVNGPAEKHGEVFTRRWIVDLILDLVGYTSDQDLANKRVVEPSCGSGAFLIAILERLSESCRRYGRDLTEAVEAISAFDLLPQNVQRSRRAIIARLRGLGAECEPDYLASVWVQQADFLLSDHDNSSADFVVGNPPYVRLEDIPADRTQNYRRAYPTMRGRSDIYVGFIEGGLRLLRPDGRLGFICADRWMRNQYGSALRELVSAEYAVDVVITMHDVDAFENDVSAYPAITVLRSGSQGDVRVVDADSTFDESSAEEVRRWAASRSGATLQAKGFEASLLHRWFRGSSLWPSGSPSRLRVVADLERRFPPLQDSRTGTRVGIGVATGCDDVYITDDESAVEAARLLPLLLASDTTKGKAEWSGRYLVNPWEGDGLVELGCYPRLQRYLEEHSDRLRSRHIAKKRPQAWYRTIDRVHPKLRRTPKLLLPDLKAESHPVLDEGDFYPHHNLYYVISDVWDLEVLGGLLLSDIANLFVGTYCVRMRGGCYRFQAQYLRQIRVPEVDAVRDCDADDLAQAFQRRDKARATAVAAKIYGVDLETLGDAVSAS